MVRRILIRRLQPALDADVLSFLEGVGSSPFDDQPGFLASEDRWVALDESGLLLGVADVWQSPGTDYAEVALDLKVEAPD
jgi:hypothetical protein